MNTRRLWAGVFVVAVGIPPRTAFPCSSDKVCQDPTLLSSGMTVPANTGGFLWRPQRFQHLPTLEPDASDLRFVASNGDRIAVRIGDKYSVGSGLGVFSAWDGWFVLPEAALLEGESYTLDHPSLCPQRGWADLEPPLPALGPVTIGPPAPIPASLGQVRVGALQRGQLTIAESSLCSQNAQVAFVDVELEPPMTLHRGGMHSSSKRSWTASAGSPCALCSTRIPSGRRGKAVVATESSPSAPRSFQGPRAALTPACIRSPFERSSPAEQRSSKPTRSASSSRATTRRFRRDDDPAPSSGESTSCTCASARANAPSTTILLAGLLALVAWRAKPRSSS